MAPEPKLPKDVAARLDHATARMTAIERRKEGKDATAAAADAKAKPAKDTRAEKKKQASQKHEEPGAPLALTR